MAVFSFLPLLKQSTPPNLQNLHSNFASKISQLNNLPNPKNLQTLHKITSRSPTIQLANRQKLKQLVESKKLVEARNFYFEAKIRGVPFGVILESMLIDALMKSGWVSDACMVFDEMPEKNAVAWASMILGCVRNGNSINGVFLFVEMVESDVLPNDFAFSAALKACGDMAELRFGEQLHSFIILLGFEIDSRISVCLIDFYSRCGSMDEAIKVFNRIVEVDVVSSTCLISGYCRNNMFLSAVQAFVQMVELGIAPNEHTIISILVACGPLLGEQIHGYMIKTTINQSVHSSSALIKLYSRNYNLESAKLVFEKLDGKNVVSWSSMISCCLHNEQLEDALKFFYKMVCDGVEPNGFTFSATIGACGLCSESIKLGQQLHCLVVKLNLAINVRVSNALITFYSRSHNIKALEKVFERTKNPDVASWCAVISGYFQNGLNERSARLLCKMHRNGLKPNEYGLSSGLSSCANLVLLYQGRQFHSLALKSGCDYDVCIGNALINMYGKCGCLDDSRLAFDEMNTHDITSWNSLIHGYAQHGRGPTAIRVFEEMVNLNHFMPDHSTFVAILLACNHMGFVDEAIKYFKIMRNSYDITPSSTHYACMIDMMGRAGKISEALRTIEEMPFEPDVLIWKTLLGSCRLQGNIEVGKFAAEKVLCLSPEDSAGYVLLSNLHAMNTEWGDSESMRMVMEDRGVKKTAGWSWIEVQNEVHAFVARDLSHPKSETIYQTLEQLSDVMKGEVYWTDYFQIEDQEFASTEENLTQGLGEQTF